MKSWIKGGLWGLGIGLVLSVINILTMGQIFGKLFPQFGSILVGLIVTLIFFVLGLIVGKFKSKNLKGAKK